MFTPDRSPSSSIEIFKQKAFETGHDVFFGNGEYNPESRSGQALLAHELIHVIQQSGAAGNTASANPAAPGAMVIQRSLQGASDGLRRQGGDVSHQARAKNVLSLGTAKSTYDQILEAVARYEREEQRGQKPTGWFQAELSKIERLCNAWLGSPKHARARETQDIAAVARAEALQVLLGHIAAERHALTPPAHRPPAVANEQEQDDELTISYGTRHIRIMYRRRDESRMTYSVAPDPNITTDGDVFVINDMEARPQGRGVGAFLMHLAALEAQQQGLGHMSVPTALTSAMPFYAKMGIDKDKPGGSFGDIFGSTSIVLTKSRQSAERYGWRIS